MKINEFDIVFLSYGEPNAEKHYALLSEIAPWVKRVDGVRGFNAAHRAAADISDTQRFVTIDADNIVLPHFFDLKIEEEAGCLSWQGRNMTNGLQYGNGGPKLWNRDFVYAMNCHEASQDPLAVDFCWLEGYHQKPGVYTEVWSCGSPAQAFRAGFREGVKLSLDRGKRLPAGDIERLGHPQNIRALKMWCSLGQDRENGEFAILGALLGLEAICDENFDMSVIRDYERFDAEISSPFFSTNPNTTTDIPESIARVEKLTGMVIPEFDKKSSVFIRDLIL
jgi:hypothetical protein